MKKFPKIDKTWTLFLDRDGVINRHLPGEYVLTWDQFEFIEGSIEAITECTKYFGRIIVVTNQQGVGKGLMTAMTLEQIHFKMIDAIRAHGGNIDAVYYCPYLSSIQPRCRKPNTGMAEQAKEDFPEINFKKSIMVGDSDSDIEMGNRLDMYSIKINNTLGYNPAEKVKIDLEINALFDLVNYIN